MALTNPRDTIKYDGILPVNLPFLIDASTITYLATATGGSASVGLAVTLSGNKTIALCADGDQVLGKLILVEADGKATVQIGGAVELPAGDSATVTAGNKIVGALGASSAKGYIRDAVATAASPTQAQGNEARKSRHTILDAATTTAVVVFLSQ
jgi:hypothetical protein